MSKKKALITGITGQDGSYLAELLLEKGYEVHGIVRRIALEDPWHRCWRINHIKDQLVLHAASLESYSSIFNTVEKVRPDELYHLAAQSFVSYSFDDEFSTINTNIDGTMHVLSAVKQKAPECRFYFAGSSEMFGKAKETPQNETTLFHPRSPYGISKVTGFHLTQNYREAYDLFACSGILFNHESPRRGFEFVTRKITSFAAKIKLGFEKNIKLGNIEPFRDWGFAGDYVQAMWMMLQQDTPDDFVIATGKTYTVKDFVRMVFEYLDMNWEDHVIIDREFYRPSEVNVLCGDFSKAREAFGWEPSVNLEKLVEMMVETDLEHLKQSAGWASDVTVGV